MDQSSETSSERIANGKHRWDGGNDGEVDPIQYEAELQQKL